MVSTWENGGKPQHQNSWRKQCPNLGLASPGSPFITREEPRTRNPKPGAAVSLSFPTPVDVIFHSTSTSFSRRTIGPHLRVAQISSSGCKFHYSTTIKNRCWPRLTLVNCHVSLSISVYHCSRAIFNEKSWNILINHQWLRTIIKLRYLF